MKNPNFPKAILHVDGDSFFVSCELARRPWLKNKPVVTGHERGIATALNPAAKVLGVTRGMGVWKIRKNFPSVVILPSDYEAYSIYSRRMCNIVRRYSDIVEEYSIDECFSDFTGLDEKLGMSYEEIAKAVKRDLETFLGITFSVGLSVNKVMAKLASNSHKPSGCTVIPLSELDTHVANIPIGKVWGIGTSTSIGMKKKGIATALDLAKKDGDWVRENFAKPIVEIYEELRGSSVLSLEKPEEHKQTSIQKTGTFRPPSSDPAMVFSELSHNIEEAARRLRKLGLFTGRVSFFLKTQEFRYFGAEVKLGMSVCTPAPIMEVIHKRFVSVFKPGTLYRATGVTLSDLRPGEARSDDLFGSSTAVSHMEKLYRAVDDLTERFGRHSIFLGSSMRALGSEYKEESLHKFGVPYLGEVG